MDIKVPFQWLYDYVGNYNLFLTMEYDYDRSIYEEKDPARVLKEQKCTTWLYIFLLVGK